MNQLNLNSFLKFGYFLDYDNSNLRIDFSNLNSHKYINCNEAELVDIGIHLWNNAISEQFVSNEENVVPLSGGLDSRAILGSLLRNTEARNINTYTFGTPGTYDYEIGNLVAKKVGTKHKKFSLNEYKYCQDELIEISKRIDHQTLLFLHPPVTEVDKLFENFTVWSGAIIDVYFGVHTHKLPATNIKDAINNFYRENIFVNSIDLSYDDNIAFDKFIDFDSSVEGILSYELVLDLLNRQKKFIAPHVLMKGYKYKTLLTKDLTDFASSIDEKYRFNQDLYKKMFIKDFPFLFSLPTKTNYGLPLQSNRFKTGFKKVKNFAEKQICKHYPLYTNRNINYIDFDSAIRTRRDIKSIIYNNIMDLKERKIVDWIDIDGIWKRHQDKQANHADALIVLASLEIHLKAGKIL